MKYAMRTWLTMSILCLNAESTFAQAPSSNCTTSGSLSGSTCTFTVTTTSDSGAGSLRQAILDANAWGNYANVVAGDSVINISTGGTITLASALPMLFSNIRINGPAGRITIDGNNSHRCFFASGLPQSPNGTPQQIFIYLTSLVLQRCVARGGNGGSTSYNGQGGGGGMGAGGGLFANEATTITLSDVAFVQNWAVGGNGGDTVINSPGGYGTGGGGGMFGHAGIVASGLYGSGGGLGGNGALAGGGIGSAAQGATPGGFATAGMGGIGEISARQGFTTNGPAGVGRGGTYNFFFCQCAVAFGGGAGGGDGTARGAGDHGGFGGGGSGGVYGGGNGGFGGGGGGGDLDAGSPGTGGFGGGVGGGYGGSGLGGGLFARTGATLQIAGNLSISGGEVSGGRGGTLRSYSFEDGTLFTSPIQDGIAHATGIFLHEQQSVTFAPSSGETQSIADVIGNDVRGDTSPLPHTAITKAGEGMLRLPAANTYRGNTALQAGTLRAGNNRALGFGTLIHTGGTLAMDSPNTLALAGYSQSAGAKYAVNLVGASCTPDSLAVSGSVSLAGSLVISFLNGCVPAAGQSFTVIRKDSAGPVSGTFSNFPGNVAAMNGANYSVNYAGGDGNDVVITLASNPTLLESVVSRKAHGSAGDFDLPVNQFIPLSGAVSVESRAIGNGHTLIFHFSQPITTIGSVTSIDAALSSVGNVVAQAAGNDIVVTLNGIPDNRRATVQLSGINGSLDVSVSLGFLMGDINGSRSVNASDISGIKARAGQATDASNFRFDINASGGINATDISAVKARSGLVIP